MSEQAKEGTILYYLTDKRFRIQRHLLLQLFLLIFASDVLFDYPNLPKFTAYRFYSMLIYLLIINIMIYPNAYIFIPRYLFTGKLTKYALSVFVLLIVSFILLAVTENTLYIQDREEYMSVESFGLVRTVLNGLATALILLLIIAGVAGFMLFRKWMEENQRADDLKAATLQIELEFLKSQINPHFLFNMLNNANILVDDEPEMASQILVKLNDMLQYQMNDSVSDKVYLSPDIVFLKDFLDLEKTRRDNFEYTISTEGNFDEVEIAPLLFIPFVENAVKHNLDSEGLSYVHLSFVVKDKVLKFICSNSIPSKDAVEKKIGGLGLANIKRRLYLLYKDNYVLVQTATDTVYSVNLEIKL